MPFVHLFFYAMMPFKLISHEIKIMRAGNAICVPENTWPNLESGQNTPRIPGGPVSANAAICSCTKI